MKEATYIGPTTTAEFTEVWTPRKACSTCANWMQLDKAPHAGWCSLASRERTTHSGQNERFGLMTTDLQVCSQWMDAHPK